VSPIFPGVSDVFATDGITEVSDGRVIAKQACDLFALQLQQLSPAIGGLMKSIVAALTLVLLTGVCHPAIAKHVESPSSVQRNKETARIWFEDVVIKQDRSGLEKILSKDVVLELPPSMTSNHAGTSKVVGVDEVIKHAEAMNKNWKVSGDTVHTIAEGNKVAMMRYETATSARGTVAGHPWITFFDFSDDGKITRIRHVCDTAQMEAAFNAASK
jgi:ketosteroid isomerase-like protein